MKIYFTKQKIYCTTQKCTLLRKTLLRETLLYYMEFFSTKI